MGLLFVHLATIWVKVKLSGMVPSPERCRAQGNTPDFMFEHFIVHPLDDTRWTPPIGRWSLTVIGIQLCTLKAEYKNPAIILQWLDTSSIVRFTLTYCSYALFYRTNTDYHLEGTSNGPPMILLPKCLNEPYSLDSSLNSLIGTRGGHALNTWEVPLYGVKWIVWYPSLLSWGHMHAQGMYRVVEAPQYSYSTRSSSIPRRGPGTIPWSFPR